MKRSMIKENGYKSGYHFARASADEVIFGDEWRTEQY